MRVVITGGSSGIGLATAKELAADGASIALVARSREGLEKAARQIPPHTHVIAADVADRRQAERAIAEAAAGLGGIDVLVSNAAAAAFGPFTEMPADDFDRTVAITFTGAVNVIRAALPELEKSGGTIVANVSIVARTPAPLQSPYSAAKHALRGFLGALRMELKSQGSAVTISMVHPSPIDTPFWPHATSETGRSPKPLRATYTAESVARAIAAAARHPRAEVTVGATGALLNLGWAVARPLTELALRTYGIAGQIGDRVAPTPGALWEPKGDGEVSGGHGGRASLFTALRLRLPRA